MYQAARVHFSEGQEIAEAPQNFESATDAFNYVDGTPVSIDGNRPWVRDTTKPAIGSFLMVGGKRYRSA